MKIGIYHNLGEGGAKVSLDKLIDELSKNNQVHVYSHSTDYLGQKNNNTFVHYYRLPQVNSIIGLLWLALFSLDMTCKKIASEMSKEGFDLIIIGQCRYTQSPSLLKHLHLVKTKVLYMFNEPLREFYEPTTYDYYSFRRALTRIIKAPIKHIDFRNSQFATNIICCSKYSQSQLKKIYKKDGIVIWPGVKKIKPVKITVANNRRICSVGLLSKIKGHDFSINQVRNKRLDILGNESHDSSVLISYANKRKNIRIIHNSDNEYKNRFLKSHSIFLANNVREPFGLTTIEALDAGCCVLGVNEGGTSELIKHGYNGYLYSRDIIEAQGVLEKIYNKRKLTLHKCFAIDWHYTSRQIIKYANFNK